MSIRAAILFVLPAACMSPYVTVEGLPSEEGTSSSATLTGTLQTSPTGSYTSNLTSTHSDTNNVYTTGEVSTSLELTSESSSTTSEPDPPPPTECEDIHKSAPDSCSPKTDATSACKNCKKRGRLAFVTSIAFHHGKIVFEDWMNIPNDDDQYGNPPFTNQIDDADMFCWQLAHQALMNGTNPHLNWNIQAPTENFRPFKAWLSDDKHSPFNDRTPTTVNCDVGDNQYILADGTVISGSFYELIWLGPRHPINMDEKGNTISQDRTVWTGTNQYGLSADKDNDCNNWNGPPNNETSGSRGLRGLVRAKPKTLQLFDYDWTEYDTTKCDDKTARIYCFEQCPE